MLVMAQSRKVAGAFLAVAATAALHAVEPALLGVVALSGAFLAAATPSAVVRLDIVAILAVWGMIAVMFGVEGAGCFILAHTAVTACARVILCIVRPVDAILVVCTISACGAPLLDMVLGEDWPVAGSLIALMSLAAPGFLLQRLTSALCSRARTDAALHVALAPLLIGLALGGGIGGLQGAAAVFVAFMLATPLFLLLAPGPGGALRQPLAIHAMGIFAAGLVACLATAAAADYAGGRFAALGPAAAIGMIAGFVALRVHAPAALARLATDRRHTPFGGGGLATHRT